MQRQAKPLLFTSGDFLNKFIIQYVVPQSSFLGCNILKLLNQMIDMCFRSTISSVTVNSSCNISQFNAFFLFFLFFLILKFLDDFSSLLLHLLLIQLLCLP